MCILETAESDEMFILTIEGGAGGTAEERDERGRSLRLMAEMGQ